VLAELAPRPGRCIGHSRGAQATGIPAGTRWRGVPSPVEIDRPAAA